MSSAEIFTQHHAKLINHCPAEPGYVLHLQTRLANWKPTDLDLHCLSLSIWLCINNLDQII